VPSDLDTPEKAAAWLRTPQAVRLRARALFQAAERDALDHFALDLERLDAAAAYVVDTIRQAYPTLEIPTHSRWRHFAAGGRDRWAELGGRLAGLPQDEIARIRIDLAVTSVLLDAGAGGRWRYREPGSGEIYDRSEGLAVASFHLFTSGVFSTRPEAPLRVDAEALAGMTAARLAVGFQAGPDNPLIGLEGRAEPRQALRLPGGPGARRQSAGRGDPRCRAVRLGADLARSDHAGRRQPRRRLATSGGGERRPDR
jgi:hypothetical protein